MKGSGYTQEDLALFSDFTRAAELVGVNPYLIGAGAIRLGTELQWEARLDRATRDWDFAVRVESWEQYEDLARHLSAEGAGFVRQAEQHRFQHELGGLLDIVPYGPLEHPAGTIRWPDGREMGTTGLGVLEVEHESVSLDLGAVHIASLPAVVGLKLLAYRDRRPGIIRDIGDVHSLLRDAESSVSDERVAAEALDRLGSEEDEGLSYSEVGAYLLGRDVGRAFPEEARHPMLTILREADDSDGRASGDVLRSAGGRALSRETVVARLRALRMGVVDAGDS